MNAMRDTGTGGIGFCYLNSIETVISSYDLNVGLLFDIVLK